MLWVERGGEGEEGEKGTHHFISHRRRPAVSLGEETRRVKAKESY